MDEDELLDELLLQWTKAAESGRELSAEEMCTEHPELTEKLRALIEGSKKLSWVAEQPERLAPGGTPIVGYKLTRHIGSGGFGQVWEAQGPRLPSAGRVCHRLST